MFDKVKRLFSLSIQTYRIYGFAFLMKEVYRYLRYGPLTHGKSVRKEYTIQEIDQIKAKLVFQPKISLITPVYNVSPNFLDECIKSVINQHYINWELCLYDDCSTRPETIECLKRWEGRDERIKIEFGVKNLHIALASNEAIAKATGSHIGFLDHDDELSPMALLRVAEALNQNPEADLIYSDEDLISPEGNYFNPHHKSDFNLSLLLSHNYITHFVVVSRRIGEQVKWLREGYEGAQDHDLILRIVEKTQQIVHLPEVLYHWRQTEASTSLNYAEKAYADKAARKALLDYASRNGIEAEIANGPGLGVYRFKRKIVTNKKVSIIIPFCDHAEFLKDCIEGIIHKTRYENLEVLLISNNSKEEKTFQYLKKITQADKRIKVLEYNKPFNFSALNNWAVSQAEGEYILMLNNDIKAINQGWLEAMLEHIQLKNVGVVGAKLLYADNTIQHAGVIIGILGVAGHSHRFFPDNSIGYYYRPVTIQNLSAVTGACLMTKKDLWEKIGGLDEEHLKIAFNDIDYCLNVRKLGFDVVYTPYARLYHYESKSRGLEDTPEKKRRFADETAHMIKKWETNRVPDPYYNINLSLNSENFQINYQ